LGLVFILLVPPLMSSEGNNPFPLPPNLILLPAGPAEEEVPPEPYGLRRLGYDSRYLLSRPFNLNTGDKRRLGLTLVVAASLFAFREEIREVVQDTRSESRSDFLNEVRFMGHGRFSPALALSFYLSSFLTDNSREKETAQMLLESMAFSAAGAAAGSFVLASERPEQGDSVNFFSKDGHGVSLDAALAASVVEPLRCQYLRVKPDDSGWTRFWKRGGSGLLYAGATLTALQRIDDDKHWAPDVFLGVLTGLSVGRSLCEAHHKLESKRVRLTAWPANRSVCVGLRVAVF
jgi:hypothetical protein